jgi:CHAT domain-containing protein
MVPAARLFASALVFATPVAPHPLVARTPEPLAPGAAVERLLRPGEVHSYEIVVLPGQFLRVEVEQNHLDAAVRILSCEDAVLREVDNAGDRAEPLSLSIEAPRGGTDRVEIRLRGAASVAGKYRLSIAPASSATAADARRLAAEAMRDRADGLLVRRSAESSRLAVESYECALAVWREIGDRREEAATLARLSDALSLLGDLRQALSRAEEALALWRVEGERRGEAAALGKLGLAYSEVGEQRRGLAFLGEALLLYRADADARGQAETLNDIAVAHGGLGELPEAVARYTDAMAFADAAGDQVGVATILKNRAVDYLGLGESDRALADLGDALARFRALGSRREEGVTLYSIGNIYLDRAEIREALRRYALGLDLLREAGDRRFQGFTLNHMGLARLAAGDPAAAVRDFELARDLLHACEDRRGEAMVLTNIGVAHLAEGDFAGARDRLRAALPEVQASSDRIHEATTLVQLARAERALGDLDASRARIEEALLLTESLRGSIPGVGERAAFMAKTHERYDLLIDVLMDLHARQPGHGWDAEALRASERARARGLIELLAGARIDLREGIDEALLARERSLEARLETARRDEQHRLAAAASPEPRASRALDALLTEYEDVQGRLRDASPRYAALARPRALALPEIRDQILDSDTLLLEYSLGDDRSFVWAVTAESFTSHELPPRAVVEAQARKLYEGWSSGTGADDARARRTAELLSRMLLGPVAGDLGKKRLAIVADGALLYVPFAALPTPGAKGTPLAATHEVVSLPSATTLAVLRQDARGRRPSERRVAVLADPVFSRRDPRVLGTAPAGRGTPPAPDDALTRSMRDAGLRDLERLAGSRSEARAIAALAGQAETFEALDFRASREAAMGPEVASARIVHFASHALLDARHPELSGIVLSLVDERGSPTDGFLQTRDVYKLRLSADLVVLSACQTALGKQVRGEGLLGLSRGFMYAGAPRVLASLWQVPDRATSELMRHFYRNLFVNGLRPADALRAAQNAIRAQKGWSSPYYWAAFILQGDWS